MRLEKRFKRLAEKTGTPALAAILSGERPSTDLPVDCMIWTGAKSRRSFERPRARRMRWSPAVVWDRPFGITSWKGKRIGVHRLLFQLISKPEYIFRMTPQCPTLFCVNPLHWEIHPVTPMGPNLADPPTTIPECPEFSEEWTEQDIKEIIEYGLFDKSIRTKEEMRKHLMPDNPPDPIPPPKEMVDAYLRSIGKPHLIW